MVATYIKKSKHIRLCVSLMTGMYLRDIKNTIFLVLHLNMSHLSVGFSCYEFVIEL